MRDKRKGLESSKMSWLKYLPNIPTQTTEVAKYRIKIS